MTVLHCPMTPLFLAVIFYIKVIKCFLNNFQCVVMYNIYHTYITVSSMVFCGICILIVKTNQLLQAVFEWDAELGALQSCISLFFCFNLPYLPYLWEHFKIHQDDSSHHHVVWVGFFLRVFTSWYQIWGTLFSLIATCPCTFCNLLGAEILSAFHVALAVGISEC